MKNKRIHHIVILILIILLLIYFYQRMSKNDEIVIKSDVERPNQVVQIGNCYSYEEESKYYGVIIIEIAKDNVLKVGILDEVEKQSLNIKNFENGNLMCAKSEIIEGYPVLGLWTGFFLEEDLIFFKDKFKFIGKIELDKSKIEENGGGILINRSEVNLKHLHDSGLLKGISRYKEPVVKIMINN